MLRTGRGDWRRGLSVSSPGLSSCAIDSSTISHGPLQGGKKARVNAAAPRRQSVGKKNFAPLTSPSCHPSHSPASFLFLSFFSFLPPSFLLGSATRGFATTIFTGLQTDERFSLKPIRFADDSRYIRSCTLSRPRVRCNPMQRDRREQTEKKLHSISTCYK